MLVPMKGLIRGLSGRHRGVAATAPPHAVEHCECFAVPDNAVSKLDHLKIILLPDVSGVHDEANRSMATTLAAQSGFPVLLLDVFRGDAWDANRGEAYETWRARHPERRSAAS